MTAIDHPVIGDKTYSQLKAVDSPRIFLHAHLVSLDHPVTGEQMMFMSPSLPTFSGCSDGLANAEVG